MQIYRVQRQADPNHIKDGRAVAVGDMADLKVIGRNIQVKGPGLIQDLTFQGVVGGNRRPLEKSLQGTVAQVDGSKHPASQQQPGKHHDAGRDAPLWYRMGSGSLFKRAHGRGSASLDAAQSSSHMSPL